MRDAAEAVVSLDHSTLVSVIGGAAATLPGDFGSVVHADLVIEREPMPGVVVASDGPIAVGLDTDLTDELRAEGLARDLISLIQGMRRDAQLAVTDRIAVMWDSESAEVAAAFATHGSLISSEVLAEGVIRTGGGELAKVANHELSLGIEQL